jgi:hypothetical protein
MRAKMIKPVSRVQGMYGYFDYWFTYLGSLVTSTIEFIFFSHCTAHGAKVYTATELLLHLPWFLSITNKGIYLFIIVLQMKLRGVLHLPMLPHFPRPLGHDSKKESILSQGAKASMATVTIAARTLAPWPHQ